MKLQLKGPRFDRVEEIQRESQNVLGTLQELDMQHAFQQWQQHWDRCVAAQGDYFESLRTGFSAKNKHKLMYPNLYSAMRPIPHDDHLQVPEPPENGLAFLEQMECEDGSSPEAIRHSSDDQYVPEQRTSESKRFNQQELNDLIRDLPLSKDKTELLASRLKERNLLDSDVRVCHCRIRNNVLKTFFRVDGPMVFCHSISGLFKELKQERNPSDWRLLIDSLQRSLEAVLLHNGNCEPSVASAHSMHLKETYNNMKMLLEAIQYDVHQWKICGDLNVIVHTKNCRASRVLVLTNWLQNGLASEVAGLQLECQALVRGRPKLVLSATSGMALWPGWIQNREGLFYVHKVARAWS
ncbi:hypothetical protein Cfor_06874 [Coptotermes formosanus]|uniref:Uncharacterized protein n=1 Tax=Coptotermes formosanus TaxID=36987 RepID=A0A6L2PI75_COPFO|nr:hypothetical protein Cfor_06874 [Coptotermes formosanus]